MCLHEHGFIDLSPCISCMIVLLLGLIYLLRIWAHHQIWISDMNRWTVQFSAFFGYLFFALFCCGVFSVLFVCLGFWGGSGFGVFKREVWSVFGSKGRSKIVFCKSNIQKCFVAEAQLCACTAGWFCLSLLCLWRRGAEEWASRWQRWWLSLPSLSCACSLCPVP